MRLTDSLELNVPSRFPKLLSLLLVTIATAPLHADPLKVYSELRRIGPTGEVVEPDRNGRPREIISPAVLRNGFASFRIVVSSPPGKQFTLHIGDNPEGSFQYTLYKEICSKEGNQWLPDKLEKVALPYTGVLPESAATLPDQTTASFWLDAWIPEGTPARRIRVEAQLNIGDGWVIYPMEFRVQLGTVPASPPVKGTLPAVTAPAGDSALGPLRSYLCPNQDKPVNSGLTIRDFIRRNAAQDMALAKSIETVLGPEAVQKALLSAIGAGDAKQWCSSRSVSFQDPEIYLKIRDFVLKTAIR